MANASNVFRVGDYVYVETNPALPYQIRRIEELTKTSNGQVEAKVQCFYRRRDLSSALSIQAEKHLLQAEEDAEIEMGDNEMEDVLRHQLSHREVFLSRQYENINANTIRGKCLVTLYNEAEILPKYLEKEDWFHYFLVYDPQQKTLVADRGEMGIGTAYQAHVPKTMIKGRQDDRDLSKLETLMWDPSNSLQDPHIEQFLVIARSVGTFARALDCSSSVKQPSLHMSAAAASRDVTLAHAMFCLHNNGYNISKAIANLVPEGGPVLCRDEMEEWSAGEANLFEEALQKYGKDFTDIQKDFKRLKAVSKECNLTQIYIPGLGGSTTQSGKKQTSTIILTPPPGVATNLVGVSCESCYDGLSGKGHGGLEPRYTCRVCGKVFNRAERLSSHMGTHKMYKCAVSHCGKVFNSQPNLTRHLTAVHGCRPPSPRKLKPRSPFYIKATPLTRLARRLCQDLYNKVHHCRVPGGTLNVQDLRAQCLKRLETPKADAIIKAKKERKSRKIHDTVEKMKANPPKPRKPKPPKPTLLPIPKEHSPTSPSPPTASAHSITSPSRKMIPPSKSYVPIQPTPPKASDWKYAAIPSAKPVVQKQQPPQQGSNHMMARKRPHDTASVQQNGIDGEGHKANIFL
ncbi:Metastasis-associated protein MTA1 [Acropora cervicornis]|uniref:Metastasis-associated protein MTA1 n=1 Tax=Acropora cervicornis TaxID=6130 RepID=A0AAD9V4T8_ACRCE|nr:Metastasis-associated protein MTA1 [Acropora cervicornis]